MPGHEKGHSQPIRNEQANVAPIPWERKASIPTPVTGDGRPPKLLDQVRNEIRLRHYSIRTEQTYAHWIARFVRFHGLRHPRDLGAPEINAFLTHLAVHDNVTASTQNQALSALVFLYYTHVLPNGPLGVASPADTPEPGTDVGLLLRQMAVMMKKLAPMAASLPDTPRLVAAFSDSRPHSDGSILLPQAAAAVSDGETWPVPFPSGHMQIRGVA